MSRKVYCAQCGNELLFILKALPKQQMVVTLVEPHKCPKKNPKIPFKTVDNELIIKDKKSPTDIDKLFDKFKFNQKLNDLNKEPDKLLPTDGIGDNRPKEDKREESSTAPMNVLNAARNKDNSSV